MDFFYSMMPFNDNWFILAQKYTVWKITNKSLQTTTKSKVKHENWLPVCYKCYQSTFPHRVYMFFALTFLFLSLSWKPRCLCLAGTKGLVALSPLTLKGSQHPWQVAFHLEVKKLCFGVVHETGLSPLDWSWFPLTGHLTTASSRHSVRNTNVGIWHNGGRTWKRFWKNTQA